MERRIYLIVEAMGPVAEDLRMTVEEFDPGALGRVAPSPDAGLAIAGAERISVAFVHADPTEFEATQLGRMLHAQGTTIIFMGDRAEERAEAGQHVLLRPFGAESVAQTLRPLLQTGAAGPNG